MFIDMSDDRKSRCERCGRRLRKGGDNYLLKVMIVSDFDGCLDPRILHESPAELIEQIEQSPLNEQELEEQVIYGLDQKICLECRNSIVAFLKGSEGDE
mgnify:CR=1 FL=1